MNYKSYLLLAVSFTIVFLLISGEASAGSLLNIFPGGKKPNGFILLVSVFMALIVTLAVHELGHLLTGLAQGFRFELFIVFLLGIKRTEKGISVFLNKDLGYMGGIAATIPVTRHPGNKKKFARAILAGPLASLLFSAVCFLLILYTKNILSIFWLTAAASSFGIFLVTTVPSKTGIFFTDRARYQRLVSGGQAAKSEEALLEIITQTTADNSCKNIRPENLGPLQHDDEGFMRFWGYYYAHEYFKANNDSENAAAAKEQLVLLKKFVSGAIWKALKLDE